MLEFLKNSKKVLGMNARNLDFIRPYNTKRARNIADDKIATKEALFKADIPTSPIFGVIHDQRELAEFDFSKLPSSFVVKPNFGYGGGGIIVIFGRHKDGAYITGKGEHLDEGAIRQHVANILDGNFSLHNVPDFAFFESRVRISKLLKPYCYQGIPDVRVIVFDRVPVMAMLRLPTEASHGKANLHQGGIGVGIDIAQGVTTTAIQRHPFLSSDRIVEYVPNTRLLLSGLRIPDWDEVLRIAVRAQEAIGLGYIGVDITFDRDQGPVVLEVNARPGLSIQNANLSPLLERLERIEGLTVKSADHGIRLSKELFGGDVMREVEGVSGKKVVGSSEHVKIVGKDERELELEAKIDTGADSAAIDVTVAEALGYKEAYDAFLASEYAGNMVPAEAKRLEAEKHNELLAIHKDIVDVKHVGSASGSMLRPYFPVKVTIAGNIISTSVSVVDRSALQYKMIIGKKDLKRFLVDVAKR